MDNSKNFKDSKLQLNKSQNSIDFDKNISNNCEKQLIKLNNEPIFNEINTNNNEINIQLPQDILQNLKEIKNNPTYILKICLMES